MLYLLNFSHPLSDTVLENLYPAETIDVKVHVDLSKPLVPQVNSILDSVGWDSREWQVRRVIVNLPGLSFVVGPLLAAIHGRSGHFPDMIVLNRTDNGYDLSEVINLDNVRHDARARR